MRDVPALVPSAGSAVTNDDRRDTMDSFSTDKGDQVAMSQTSQVQNATSPQSPDDLRRASWASSTSTSSSDRVDTKADTIPLDYQMRYLSEQMSKLHPLQRYIWWRQDYKDDTPSSPPELLSDSVHSSTSSTASNSPIVPPIPLVQVSCSSGTTTPKASAQTPANVGHPRGKSEAAQDRSSSSASLGERRHSAGPPSKGVRFAEQPLVSQPDKPSSNAKMISTELLTTTERQWGKLYFDGLPTQKMKDFLEAIAKTYLSPNGGDIDPVALYGFYETFALEPEKVNYKEMFMVSSLDELSAHNHLIEDFGIQYRTHIVHGEIEFWMTVPGFIQWMLLNIQAFPDEECKRLNLIIAKGISGTFNHLNGSAGSFPAQITYRVLGDPKPEATEKFMRTIMEKHPRFLSSSSIRTGGPRSFGGGPPGRGISQSSPVVVQHHAAVDTTRDRTPSHLGFDGRSYTLPYHSRLRRSTLPNDHERSLYDDPYYLGHEGFHGERQPVDRSRLYADHSFGIPTSSRAPPSTYRNHRSDMGSWNYPRESGVETRTAYARGSRDSSRRESRRNSYDERRDGYGDGRYDRRDSSGRHNDPRRNGRLSQYYPDQRERNHRAPGAQRQGSRYYDFSGSQQYVRAWVPREGVFNSYPRHDAPSWEDDSGEDEAYTPPMSPRTSTFHGEPRTSERRRHKGRSRDRSRERR
ncbi:hypothetical protein LIA77_06301 [Sarocladium implicatum]|nr:hypothetical protein LIA77_06301 [Sarocladium implicatum]